MQIIQYFKNKRTDIYAKQTSCYCGGYITTIQVPDKRCKSGFRWKLKNCYPYSLDEQLDMYSRKLWRRVKRCPD
jgi:hypothetical protein